MRASSILALAAVLLGAPSVDGQPELLGIDYTTGHLWTIDTSTGAAGNPRATGLTGIVGLAGSPDGTLYGLMGNSGPTPNSLWSIDPITGTATLIGSTGLSPIEEGGLAFDPARGHLYGVGWQQPTGSHLFRIDRHTGSATDVGPMPPGIEVSGLCSTSSGALFGLCSEQGLFALIDENTAAVIGPRYFEIALGSLAGLAIHPHTSDFWVTDGGPGAWEHMVRFSPLTPDAAVVGNLGLAGGLSGLTFYEPISASATFRNDTQGTNDAGYYATPPVIGSTWICSVNDTALAHTWVGVAGYAFPDEVYLPAVDDWLLVNTHPLLTEMLNLAPQAGGGIVQFSIPIPNAIHLYGRHVSTQAYGVGGPAGVTLFNAYDLVMGG